MREASSLFAFLSANDSRLRPFGSSLPKIKPTWAPRFSPIACAMSSIATVQVSLARRTSAPTSRFSFGDVWYE